jgi:glycerol transport system ATP-binding protein
MRCAGSRKKGEPPHDQSDEQPVSLVLDGIALTVGADVVISGVSLVLERGTMNVLLGPTQAGKTTLMRIMAGLDRPSAGRLILDGKDVTGVPVRLRSVAMVYQQFVNYPTLTVYENIASPLRVARLASDEIDARVTQAAELLRLEGLLQRMPAELSGGQQQRTAIARALVKRADVVLLDEPLANLDYKLREELREQLPRIFAESNAILVYATTEPAEALLLGGNTATVWEGRVTQHGPTPDVYRRPQNIAAARVFSDPPLNELPVEKRGAAIVTKTGRQLPAVGVLANLPDGHYRVGFRCDDATLGATASSVLSFPGTVSVTELSGSESFVHVDVGVGTWVCLIRGVHDWQPGATVEFHVNMRGAFVFDAAGNLAAAPDMAASA